MVNVRIKISKSDEKYLRKLSKPGAFNTELERELVRTLNRVGLIVTGKIVRDYIRKRLNTQSGNLARSITHQVDEYRGLPSLRIGVFRGPALAYAAVQEYGTKSANPKSPIKDIKPKRAKALAWPIGFAGGVTKSPRDFAKGDLKFVPYRRGQIAIGALYDRAEYQAAKEASPNTFSLYDIEPLFVLLRKLVLQPNYYLRDGVLANINFIAQEVAKSIKEGLASR